MFLHPAQRQVVERSCGGRARVSGSAGTGNTIVALHRAVHLARTHPGARLLLTTFSTALAEPLITPFPKALPNDPIAQWYNPGALAPERLSGSRVDKVVRRCTRDKASQNHNRMRQRFVFGHESR